MNDQEYLNKLIQNERESVQLFRHRNQKLNSEMAGGLKKMPNLVNQRLKDFGVNVNGGAGSTWAENGIFSDDDSLSFVVNYDTGKETLARSIRVMVISKDIGKSYKVNASPIKKIDLKNVYQVEFLERLLNHLNKVHHVCIEYRKDLHETRIQGRRQVHKENYGKINFTKDGNDQLAMKKAFDEVADEISVMVLAWIATIQFK